MRALAWFWAALLAAAVIGGAVLQWRGPVAAGAASALPAHPKIIAAAPPAPPGRAIGGPIAPPDPALLEPSPDFVAGFLPRIGSDHRMPMDVYAAPFDPPNAGPTIAILLAGIGMSTTDSDAAIKGVPAAVSLAVSPYSIKPEPLLAEARLRGHEYFLSIPMEPAGYPLDDPGNRALLTGNAQGVNDQHLAWALTRFGGYVGATGALGALHGERFADSPTQFGPALTELAHRGLLYVDPRPGAAIQDGVVGRAIDLVIDSTPGAPDIDAALARLEQTAKARGSAIGLVSLPRPTALDRLAAWAAGLPQRGLTLAPVSAVARTAPRVQQAAP